MASAQQLNGIGRTWQHYGFRQGCPISRSVGEFALKVGELMPEGTDWRRRSSRLLGVVDAFVVIWAVVGAFIIRFGFEPDFVVAGQEFTYAWLSVALAVVWWLMLGAWNSRQSRVLGSGPDEYKRVAAASLWLFGLVAIVSYVLPCGHGEGIRRSCAASGLDRAAHGALANPAASQHQSSAW
jgi:hypothetical protein